MLLLGLTAALPAQRAAPAPIRGLSAPETLAATYHLILDADFDRVSAAIAPLCPSAPAWCTVMQAVSRWWRIALDADDRQHDAAFTRAMDEAIDATERWTRQEPQRAEAWFARGAALGARAQWRVARGQRLAAARDGKHIKDTLERALAIDPFLHDAKFGLGMYRYYAAVAPAALRMLRWLLWLPGGDRPSGLRLMNEARDQGLVVGGEADYQLHLLYLWYEDRARDAWRLITRLQDRYPRNPLFALAAAEIQLTYFHDRAAGRALLQALLVRAEAGEVNVPRVAVDRARRALAAIDERAAANAPHAR